MRDSISKYEAVSLALVETSGPNTGKLLDTFPPMESPLRFERFFETIYRRYDERFVFAAPILATRNVTPRIEWDPNSPLFNDDMLKQLADAPQLDYEPRTSST